MIKHSSLFSQLLQLFPRYEFAGLVGKYRNDFKSKGFRSWDQFVSMLFCQLAQAKSLREICNGLKSCLGKLIHLGVTRVPNKSTLSYANEHRSWELYRDLFYKTLDRVRFYAPKNKLLTLDATVIDLCLSMFPWAEFRRTKGAVKLHLLFDHDGYLPTYAYISEGKIHEVNIAHLLKFPEGSIVVVDKGFTDYSLYSKWSHNNVWFVTRMKDNARYKVIEKRVPAAYRGVISDEIIQFTGYYSKKVCPYLLRRIVIWDEKEDREIVLLTNHMKFGSSTIGYIYKDRWNIEIFFRTLKQNLKIKTFVGTSINALKIQIWTALIAILLIKLLKFRATINWSTSNLIALLRMNLFTYRNLWDWLNDPFETPPDNIFDHMVQLTLPGLGQHQTKIKK